VRCRGCGKENRADASFCRGCGAPLARACPACGSELPDDGAFCDRCGTRVEAPAAPSPAPASYTPAHLAARIRATRAALEGERKVVTVLFADVVESTTIAERVGPEEMRTLMDRCFGYMLEEVHRCEGTVIQFTGDGIMALFGAPLALEDAPRRAVVSALAIQRTLARCREELRGARQVELQVRIGVHTGLVVVGRIGNDLRMEYTAIGDTTNLAARLQTLAAPGSVLISEATQRLAGAFLETRDLGFQRVKGKTEPVHVYEVLAERASQTRIDALADVGLTPLAGRERELAALREAFDQAQARRGQVLFLVGEAGIGKSRLLYEFRRGLAGTPHLWMEGRCASNGASTAFLPLVDALQRTLGIVDRDDEAAALDKIDAAVPDDLAWARPLVRLLLSLPAGDPAVERLDAVTRRSETFRALKAFNLRAAETQPVVVVVEDVHWVDPASEEYLGFLADSIPAAPVLLILTHRPGYSHAFGDRSYHRRIALDALSASHMAGMAKAILGADGLPAPLRELIVNKAEGNPLFVEEVTKSLLEEGAIRREEAGVVLVRPLSETAVPDSIQGVLMARLDRLAEEPKRALQMASVIGREFALRLLVRVSDVGEVSGLVSELRGLELIYEKAAHPELAYMFKHALTHDVAYESLLVQRRKELHRTIGLAIEELYAERLAEHYETLAHHFSRGEDWPRALDYHTRAAEKALGAYATRAVIDHCRAGLAIHERLGDAAPAARRQALEEMLGAASFYTSAFVAAGEAYTRAAALAPSPEGRARALVRAAESFTWGHRYDTSTRSLAEAVRIARAHGLTAVQSLALAQEAFQGVVTTGEFARFGPLLDEAIRAGTDAGSEEALAVARTYLFQASDWLGRYGDAVALCEQVIEAGRRLRLPSLVIFAEWFRAKSTSCLGDYGGALAALRRATDLCERIGDRAWRTRLLNTTGWALTEIGAHHEARDYNERAAVLAHEVGDPEIIANAEINLALNHVTAGAVDAAGGYLEPLHRQASGGDPWMRWRWGMHVEDALGRLALARREPAAALAHGDVELVAASRHGARKVEARAHELRARALLALERVDDAAAAAAAALDVATAIAYPTGQWRALTVAAETDRRRGRRGAAAAAATRVERLVASLAASLPDDALRHALHTAARVTGD
jgi:class 3 adenylate cyclase/tetratricopeptide (TPR) repeat protein